jgi:SSS family solute:Na+ symporter
MLQVLVSLASPHRHTSESEKLVWDRPLDCLRTPGWKGIGDYRVLSVLLFVMMVALYVIFA